VLRKTLLIAVLLLPIGFLAPTKAQAADTITVGSTAELTARVLVNVPVTVTCGPYVPISNPLAPQVGVTVTQASGKSVASGTGFVSTPTCDGTPHDYVVPVTPNSPLPPNVPFHGGKAIVSGSEYGCPVQLPDGTTTCVNIQVGPQVITLNG
jgi:hypothetical protein